MSHAPTVSRPATRRFYVAVRGLRDATSSATLRRPGSLDRVHRIGLALQPSSLTIGAIDLDHLDTLAAQQPRQSRAIRAGALNPNTPHVTEARQPLEQLPIARRSRFERLHAQHSADRIQRRRDMRIEVRVHTARDRARLYDGHRHPFCSLTVKGWHARPGTETVSSTLRLQRTRSPSGTGRAGSRASRQAPNRTRCCEPSQTGTGPLNVTVLRHLAVDSNAHITFSLARMRYSRAVEPLER